MAEDVPDPKRNVLILQNRRDPATPLSTARGMRQAMGGDATFAAWPHVCT
ncbi:alpha/beta hydrolase [Streptomyces sviceus]